MSVLRQLLRRLQSKTPATGSTFSHLQMLRQQNEQLREVINKLQMEIFMLEPDGTIAFWSEGSARLIRESRSQAVGKRFDHVLRFSSGRERLRRQLWDVMEERGPVATEYVLLGKPIRLTLTPLLNEGRKVVSILGELEDITGEKQVEEMKVDFVNVVSHELRTPIASIKGNLDVVLKEADYLTPEHRKFLQRAFESNERQLATVEALLSVSQIEHGTIEISPEPVQVEAVIMEAISRFEGQAQRKGLELKYVFPHLQLPQVLADPRRFREVLGILLDNAIKYTDEGSISVYVDREGQFLVTSVEDTGNGIPPQVHKVIFEKFSRGGRSLTAELPGKGLGLYIAKSLIELMGGKIWLKSSLGHGSTFSFSLPVIT